MRQSLLRRERIFAIALIAPCFLFVITFAFYPILYSFYLSLHKIILAVPSIGRPFIGLENYRELLNDGIALHSLINTLLFVSISTFFEIVFGLIIALLFRTMDAFRVFDLVFVMTQGGPADSTNVLQFYGYKKIFTEGLMGYGSTISVVVFLMALVMSMLYIRVMGTGLFQDKR